ncbi:MAG: nitroreductase family protein [Bacillota bacterium]|nr:nitroreductase family protein [Bacillota bacterium]
MNKQYCQDIIKNRRSIRKFKSCPVDDEHLEMIIEAARLAPSGTNRQPWRFILMTSEKEKNIIKNAVIQPFVLEAPALFLCCLDRSSFTRDLVEKRMQELIEAQVVSKEAGYYIKQRKMPLSVDDVILPPSAYLDLGIAVENMVLMAASLGLGSCWVRLFDAQQVREALSLPTRIEPVVLLPVGYPAETPPPRPRLKRDELLIKIKAD